MSRLGRSTWWIVALAAVAGLLLSLVVLSPGRDDPGVDEVRGDAAVSASVPAGPSPASERPGARTVGRTDGSLGVGRAAPVRPPVRLQVPALEVDVRVRPVGVSEDRQMAVPSDPRVLGWYRYGPGPGGAGSVVLAGHVDSRRFGVGPLARLSSITAGDRIKVWTSAGRPRSYRVDSIERFDRQALPAAVFGRTGPERLRLVTCTGPFLPGADGYQQNLVVTAVPA